MHPAWYQMRTPRLPFAEASSWMSHSLFFDWFGIGVVLAALLLLGYVLPRQRRSLLRAPAIWFLVYVLLEGNAQFVKNEFRTNLDHYQRIAQQQSAQVLWIGCSDSRVSEDVVTGSKSEAKGYSSSRGCPLVDSQ